MSKANRKSANQKSSSNRNIFIHYSPYRFAIYVLMSIFLIIIYILYIFIGTILFGVRVFLLFIVIGIVFPLYKLAFAFRDTNAKLKNISLNQSESKGGNLNEKDDKPKAYNDIFFRIYEVIAALSIYEASIGVISGTTSVAYVVSPLNGFFFRPQQIGLYFVFLITSVQFIVGTSQHFEIPSKHTSIPGPYALLNYLLILGEGVSLLGMALSVASNSLLYFAEWFISLLMIDLIWIAVYTVFNMPTYGLSLKFPYKLNQLESMFFKRSSILQIVHGYWIEGNVAFVLFLAIPIPLLYENFPNLQPALNIYIFLLIIITLAATYVNSKCLLAINAIK